MRRWGRMTERKHYQEIFQQSYRDLRIYHGYLLARMTDASADRPQEMAKLASKADAIEGAIRTLEAIESSSSKTVHTNLEEEYLSLSEARFNALEALEDTENEDELKGPGVY